MSDMKNHIQGQMRSGVSAPEKLNTLKTGTESLLILQDELQSYKERWKLIRLCPLCERFVVDN